MSLLRAFSYGWSPLQQFAMPWLLDTMPFQDRRPGAPKVIRAIRSTYRAPVRPRGARSGYGRRYVIKGVRP